MCPARADRSGRHDVDREVRLADVGLVGDRLRLVVAGPVGIGDVGAVLEDGVRVRARAVRQPGRRRRCRADVGLHDGGPGEVGVVRHGDIAGRELGDPVGVAGGIARPCSSRSRTASRHPSAACAGEAGDAASVIATGVASAAAKTRRRCLERDANRFMCSLLGPPTRCRAPRSPTGTALPMKGVGTWWSPSVSPPLPRLVKAIRHHVRLVTPSYHYVW